MTANNFKVLYNVRKCILITISNSNRTKYMCVYIYIYIYIYMYGIRNVRFIYTIFLP